MFLTFDNFEGLRKQALCVLVDEIKDSSAAEIRHKTEQNTVQEDLGTAQEGSQSKCWIRSCNRASTDGLREHARIMQMSKTQQRQTDTGRQCDGGLTDKRHSSLSCTEIEQVGMGDCK